jgi:uncharacterized phage protein gp47/JayE|nr:MAG TPA: Baseplate wedge protein [Caudoviricetes sp.]
MGLTDKGYHRPTYNEILQSKIQTAKELFGEDIDTGELSALGKFIRIGAYDLSKAYEDLEMIYYARFPNTASGISLDRLCVFAGIDRNAPTRAQHKVRVYGEAGTKIGVGQLILGKADDVTFYNVNPFEIDSGGTVEITVECSEAGTVGNITGIENIVNPLAEVSRAEYLGLLKAGEEEETDYQLRKRFRSAIEGAGSANVNAIKAAILRVPTVTSVGIIANETDAKDEKGRPARSFECFVYGGEGYEKEIAETIFEKAPIGIKTCSTSENPVSVTLIDDGGYEHMIRFSHTEYVDVYLNISIRKNNMFEEDGDTRIKNVLVEYINDLGVSTDVVLSSLYGYVYTVPGVADVSIAASLDGEAYGTENIVVGDWQVARISADNIHLAVIA